MSIRSQFINDVQARANIKLAGFAEMKPYLTNALLGGSALSLFTAVPALLHAYANDEDGLKTLADVTKYSMPIGALLGAGATGASHLSSAVRDSLGNFGDKLSNTAMSLGNNALGTLKSFKDPVVNSANEVFGSIKSLPYEVSDALYSIFG